MPGFGLYRVVVYFAEMCDSCVNPDLGGSGPVGSGRRMMINVEGAAVVGGYEPADAALAPSRNGIGVIRKATELVFHVEEAGNGFLEILFIDLGGGNPPGDPAVKALSVTRLNARRLAHGAPLTTRLTPAQPSELFYIQAGPGAVYDIRTLNADTLDVNAFYGRWDDVPTSSLFDIASTGPLPHIPKLVVPSFRNQTLLLRLQANHINGGFNDVRIDPSQHPIALVSNTPDCVGQGGLERVRTTIRGAGFDSRFSVILGNSAEDLSVDPIELTRLSPTVVQADFDLRTSPLGLYFVQARLDLPVGVDPTALLSDSFQIKDTTVGPRLNFGLDGTGNFRPERLSKIDLWYENEGDEAMTAPIFKVVADAGVQMRQL